jgi:fructoselysine 6-phosphate deglycase
VTNIEIKNMATRAVKSCKDGIGSVYFVACGGSLGALYPAKSLIERESCDLRVGWLTSAEFVQATPRGVDSRAVVMVVSHQGNTPETVQAARIAQELGAYVVGLSYAQEPALARHCHELASYSFGEGRNTAEEKLMRALRFAAELLAQTEGWAAMPAFNAAVADIDAIVKRAVRLVEDPAAAFAQNFKDDRLIYTIGSGAGWGAAYMQSICILMEMQWIHSACISSGEFFHGPFEITEPQVPFMVQLSAGSTRPLDMRVVDFLSRYGGRYEVIDALELGLSQLDPSVVDYFNHSLYSQVYHVYNKKLATARNHALSTRRYMHKVDY